MTKGKIVCFITPIVVVLFHFEKSLLSGPSYAMCCRGQYGVRNLALWEHNETILGDVADLIKATSDLLLADKEQNFLRSGEKSFPRKFKESLCAFLQGEYNEKIESANVTASYGATQGLGMVLSLLFPGETIVFVEDATYHYAITLFQDNGCSVIPVTLKSDGIDIKEFERLLKKHCSKPLDKDAAYSAITYLIPSIHNPTGIAYSEDCCKEVVRLAREYNVLIFCDDVYNSIVYCDKPVGRLLSFDRSDDADYGRGHVVSNGTFSKMICPAIRLGWIEAPAWLIEKIENRFGNVAVHCQLLFNTMWDHHLFLPYLKKTKAFYKNRMQTFCKRLTEALPEGFSVQQPKGGFFVWLHTPGINTSELLEFCKEKYNLSFIPGSRFSLSGKHDSFARLSISTPLDDELLTMADNLGQAIRHFKTR